MALPRNTWSATGVFAFYPDQLLRVAGRNYQFASSHTESEQLEDEGELTGWTRPCVYRWEAYGVWRYNQVTPGWTLTAIPNYGLAAGQGTMPIERHGASRRTGTTVSDLHDI